MQMVTETGSKMRMNWVTTMTKGTVMNLVIEIMILTTMVILIQKQTEIVMVTKKPMLMGLMIQKRMVTSWEIVRPRATRTHLKKLISWDSKMETERETKREMERVILMVTKTRRHLVKVTNWS